MSDNKPDPTHSVVSVTDTALRYDANPATVRLEFDAIVSEFQALRNEVNMRIEKQQEITNFALVLTGGLAALIEHLNENRARPSLLFVSSLDSSILPLLYPLISILLSAFALMTLDHEANIALLYQYGDTELQPRLKNLLGDRGARLWHWNIRRAQWQHHSGLTSWFYVAMSWSKYVITVGPSIVLFTLFLFLVWPLVLRSWEFGLLFLAAAILLLAVFLTSGFVALRYYNMGRKRSPHNGTVTEHQAENREI